MKRLLAPLEMALACSVRARENTPALAFVRQNSSPARSLSSIGDVVADGRLAGAQLGLAGFLLSAFPGRTRSARTWDGQTRKRILVAGPPQPGSLHGTSERDPLGHDRKYSRCKP